MSLLRHNYNLQWQCKKVFILLICLSPVFNYCPGSYTAPFLTCTFNYQYQDQNCTQFVLDNCTWVECVAYVTVDNVTECSEYQTLSLTNWNECTAQCCIGSKTYPQTYASLQQCEADVKKRTILIVQIVFSVLGGIVLIIIIVCCTKRYLASHPNACNMSWLFYYLTCRCFRRRRQNIRQLELNINNTNGFSQVPPSNQICVMCIEKGLIPYQTPFMQMQEKQPYICEACKMNSKL